jgi:hypothetical protein
MSLVDGSDQEKQYHIILAKRMFCGKPQGGMMGERIGQYARPGMRGYGMMNGYGGIWTLFMIISVSALTTMILSIFSTEYKERVKSDGYPEGEIRQEEDKGFEIQEDEKIVG